MTDSPVTASGEARTPARLRTLVVIPTYDERENLPRLVPRILEQGPAFDILVVDDNSPDGTGALAEEMAAGSERIHVLRRPGKAGLGAAYVAGLQWGLDQARYEVLVEMDADLSHPPEQLGTFLDAIRTGAEVVVGSRYVDGRVTVVNWPISRLLISLFGSWYARTITGLPVRDATGGFNAFTREVLAGLGLDRIQSNGYSFQIELKYRAWKQGRRIVEVPIVFTERDSGESKMSKRIVREAVWRVWKLRLMALLGKL